MKAFYVFMSLMALIIVVGFLMFISNKFTNDQANTALNLPLPETSTYVERESNTQTVVPVHVPQAQPETKIVTPNPAPNTQPQSATESEPANTDVQ